MNLKQSLILLAWASFNALLAYSVMWSAKTIGEIIKGENK